MLMVFLPLDIISFITLISSYGSAFLSFKTIKGKLAHYILQLKTQEDGLIKFPVTQQALADLFGVARPSVARALKEAEDEGIIKSKNRQIEILDHPRLVALLNE